MRIRKLLSIMMEIEAVSVILTQPQRGQAATKQG
jgi:hypothetical protein